MANFEYADVSTLARLASIWKGDWDRSGNMNFTRGGEWREVAVGGAMFLLTTSRGSTGLGRPPKELIAAMVESLQSARPDVYWKRHCWPLVELTEDRIVGWR
jgi:hypothetical protein